MEIGFNTLLVLLSVMALGLANGVIGVYVMLYKKALVSDAASHAALPGIALGYFIANFWGLESANALPVLLMGAAITGFGAIYSIDKILKLTKLKEDAAIAIALSVYFALGIVLFSIIQSLDNGTNRSGLDSFLLGQASGITTQEAYFITFSSVVLAIIAIFHHKHLIFQSFDPVLSRHLSPSNAWTQRLLPLLMMGVICIGLKTAGAILILALLIIPAGCARLCSNNNKGIIMLATSIAILGAIGGTLISATPLNPPTGATITATLFVIFLVIFVGRGLFNLSMRTKTKGHAHG